MSPSWRDEAALYVAPRRVCMVRLRRGLKPAVMFEHDAVDPAASSGYEDALALLERELAQRPCSGAAVRVVIADAWARYAVVPWSDALDSAAERLGHARELLASTFGDEMADWSVTLSDTPPGSSSVASALPAALLESLRTSAALHGLKLASMQPRLIARYNAWRHALPAGPAWFVTIEKGSLAALRLCADGIDRVYAVRIGPDWARELKRLQAFGRLASSNPADGRVYVDLPESLRGLCPAASADLQWLEAPDPSLSILHRLEHLRGRAA